MQIIVLYGLGVKEKEQTSEKTEKKLVKLEEWGD